MVRTLGYLVVIWLFAVLLSGVSLGAVLDPSVPGDLTGPAAAVVAFPLLAAGWSLRLSVTVTEEYVVVRDFFRGHRFPRDLVTEVVPVNYDGFWTRGARTRFLMSVRFSAADRHVTAYCLPARPSTARATAVRLRAALRLPAGSSCTDRPAQHRAS